MTTAYTSLLGLALPVTGELSGTWGQTVNDSITSLLDTSVAGTTNVSTDGDVTLTTTTGAANTARQAILLFSGARTALRTVTAPAQSKIYTVINATTGGFSVKLVGSGPTTGLTIPNGASAVVAWNGSDFVEIGAGSIGNLIVNGTLTVTGATTLQSTLAVTGNITNTAGTANGVTYLNGSKVLTSGSALTFDGTNFGTTGNANLGSGSKSTDTQINLLADTGTQRIYIERGSRSLVFYDVGAAIENYRIAGITGIQTWGVGGSEQMRLTSTGLGIGTSSPSEKLEVVGNYIKVTGTTNQVALRATNTGGDAYFGIDNSVGSNFNTGTAYAGVVWRSGANPICFVNNSSEKMRLDSSGNLGLGVTPSAWDGALKAIQVNTQGVFASETSAVHVMTNVYYNSGYKYIGTGYATDYYQYNGLHAWRTAASGTVGNAITWTQAMTLGADGLLTVGTTTNSELGVVVAGGAKSFSAGIPQYQFQAQDTTAMAAGVGGAINFVGKYTTGGSITSFASIEASKENATSGDYGASLVFKTRVNGGAQITGMTLNSARNLGLGCTPSAWGFGGNLELPATNNISFQGAYGNILSNAYYDLSQSRWEYTTTGYAAQYQLGANGQHIWNTAPSGTAGNAITFTQAMTLDASGNLLVGTTSAGYSASNRGLIEVNGTSSALIGLKTGNTNRGYLYTQGTDMIAWAETGAFTIGTAGANPIGFTTNNTERARILSGGTVCINTTSYISGGSEKLTVTSTGDTCFFQCTAGSGGGTSTHMNRSVTSGNFVYFTYTGSFTPVGSISTNGSTTAYNTSSDYRLKNTIAPMTGALARVAQLKPVTYKWNADGSDGEGFIAHELAEVVPQCVTGEKDAVDENGKIKPQSIDTSFLVATLTAAIQEQQAIIESLKARLDAANL